MQVPLAGVASSGRQASPANWAGMALQPEKHIAKQTRARNLQDDWQQQINDKAEQMKQYERAESCWPYSPPKQSHARVALTPPRHAAHSSVAAWGIPAARSLA